MFYATKLFYKDVYIFPKVIVLCLRNRKIMPMLQFTYPFRVYKASPWMSSRWALVLSSMQLRVDLVQWALEPSLI